MSASRAVVVSITSLALTATNLVASPAELVRFERGTIANLLELPVESAIVMRAWPLASSLRADVVLTRHEIYSPEAVVYKMDGQDQIEIPRSRLQFLWGRATDEDATPVLVTVDPDTASLHGYSGVGGKRTEVRRASESETDYLLVSEPDALEAAGARPSWTCADGPGPELVIDTSSAPRGDTEAISTLHRATLAVDTDNELLSLKFSNDTTNATNYIATLVALMSVIYERDLLVRTLQGTTILRVSTTPDPYVVVSGDNADSAKLDEFKNWWVANQAGVPRAVAMMLSGKQPTANSASGIASVNALCSATRGYSFSQVFKYSGSTAASDVSLVAHEIGHNFGSPHTHCYSPPIDTCYAGESGCYSGATACPAPTTINGVTNVRGTLMSYCHLLGGCSASAVFHPRSVDVIAPIIESKVGVCVFPAATPQEASPAEDLRAARGTGTTVTVTYAPACGASGHTVYAGSLDTLRVGGIAWNQRFCALGTSGSLTFNPGTSNVYFVVVGNSGSTEGSYGRSSTGERPAAGAGGACSYTQSLGGTCP